MTPERWSRIKELFGAALETPEPERSKFLESVCGADPELRADVERLLSANRSASWQSPAETLFPIAAELVAGNIVAQYRIDGSLGEGGMGKVYKAFDTRLQREVALKVLPPEHLADPGRRQRLMAEARAASALNHSHIVTVYEVGSERGMDFISMEYIEGRPLAETIPDKGLPLARVLDYALQIAGALTKAHAAGVIHRDLKPSNIMVTREGQTKLLDFGLARRALPAERGSATLTVEGLIGGTVGYMSPEQVRGLETDHRTDLFSFGVVLYEMTTGRRPFTGRSAMAVCDATLHDPPSDFGDHPAPGKLKSIIRKLLEKDPANRFGSADEVHRELKAVQNALAPARDSRLSRNARIAVSAAIVVVAIFGSWLWRKSSRERWALQTATPEIARLVDAGEYLKAATLAREARAVLPKDPTIEKLWMGATGEVSIATVPAGADVSIRLYRGDANAWETVGKTPLHKVRLPREAYVWRVAKPGYAPIFYIGQPPGAPSFGYDSPFNLTWRLRRTETVPPEMVVVPGGRVGLAHPLNQAPKGQLEDFLIDRHEVTNEEYKKFVDAGGYQKREFWKQPFLKDGRTIAWEDAVAQFQDATGRPGPATWEVGEYPKGHENYPVAGVSWYEAAAYAEFVGKTLPTAYHWTLASQATQGIEANGYVALATGFTPLITPGSNFGGTGTQPVGAKGSLSGFGTTDMAGNVKEWCWNEAKDGERFILGGGFGEPDYQFNHTDSQSPWDRRANFGFRCAKLDSPASAAATARIEVSTRDFSKEKPAPDDIFKAYTALYTYDEGELNAHVEDRAIIPAGSREKVTFDAAYGHERVSAYLFLPKNAAPPVQTVVFFPGAAAFLSSKIDLQSVEEQFDFLLKGGRALLVPTFKGSYDRRDEYKAGGQPPGLFRDHVIMWSKDLSRSLDYIKTRKEIDGTKVAFFGASLGGAEAPILAVVEKRIKTVIISSGGFQLRKDLPEVDPFNFAPHVTVPVLMLSGRYDATFPLESSQFPLFRLFGTPLKKQVIYEGNHGAFPRPEAVRETLDWLDQYLGPVRPAQK